MYSVTVFAFTALSLLLLVFLSSCEWVRVERAESAIA